MWVCTSRLECKCENCVIVARVEGWTYTNRLVVVEPCLRCEYCFFMADRESLEFSAVSSVETVVCTLQRVRYWQK